MEGWIEHLAFNSEDAQLAVHEYMHVQSETLSSLKEVLPDLLHHQFCLAYLNLRKSVESLGILRRILFSTPDCVQDTRSTVLILHDYGVGIEKYMNVSKYFVDQDIRVLSFEFKGHGENEIVDLGKGDFLEFSQDLLAFLTTSKKLKMSSGPLFIVAEGMSCLVLLSLLKSNEESESLLKDLLIKGIVFISPLAKILTVPKLPNLFSNEKLTFVSMKRLTNSEEIYEKNKYFPNKATPSFLKDLVQIQKELLETNEELKLPDVALLQLVGKKDKFISSKQYSEFFQRLKSSSKTTKEYERLAHDLFLDDKEEEVLSDIANWIESLLL